MDTSVIDDRKARARTWFEALRDDLCLAFEQLEDEAPAPLYPGNAGRFGSSLSCPDAAVAVTARSTAVTMWRMEADPQRSWPVRRRRFASARW